MKKVSTKWVIALQPTAKTMVRPGEKVIAGQTVARDVIVKERIINIPGMAGLSPKEMEEFAVQNNGRTVTEGEILFETNGFFKKKLISPAGGKIVRIDEFRNVHIQSTGEGEREIQSPTQALVESVNSESITLEFEAEEYTGRGLVEGRMWAHEGIKMVERMGELSFSDCNKIILLKKLTPAMLLKAEVVGVNGIVILDEGEDEKNVRINFKLPILAVGADDWKTLLGKAGDKRRAMINTQNGRLLLVI